MLICGRYGNIRAKGTPTAANTGFDDFSSFSTVSRSPSNETDWTNPSNAAVSNNSYATCQEDTGGVSYYLKCLNFGTTLPASTISIDGIQVRIEWSAGTANKIAPVKPRLYLAGSLDGSSPSGAWSDFFVPASEATSTIGGSTDTWGGGLTGLDDTDINDTGFGMDISLTWTGDTTPYTCSIDVVEMDIYYTYLA